MTDILSTPDVQAVLSREHELSDADQQKMADRRAEIDAAKNAGKMDFELYPKDVYLCIEPAMGQFLNLCARAIDAKTIVEFGTSFGISTIYLAAAAKQTGGQVITTELEPSKAAKAKANLEEAGLADVVEIRVGDAMQTLQDSPETIDLLFLDGWKDLYLPIARMLTPRVRQKGIVLADNIISFPTELQAYLDFMEGTDSPFRAVTLPFDSGLQYAVKTG